MSKMVFAIFVMSLALVGCDKKERAEAGDRADRAVKETEQALKGAGSALSDASVTAKVKSAMSVSDKLDSSDIDVDTKNKTVYLRGTVADENQRALAERIAQDTVGNDITVVNELKAAAIQKKAAQKAKPI